MEYDIVKAVVNRNLYAYEALKEAMKRWIADGWKPQGGPVLVGDTLLQAVVREAPARESY